MTDSVHRLIYIGDPMCSWCWGFAPEIEQLAEDYPVDIVVGGLRPGPSAQELDDRMAGFLQDHWVEIAERTGQPFDTGFLNRRDGWLYDTEPAAVAVVAMRAQHEEETLAYFASIQHAFYADGVDVTDFGELAALAGRHDVDADAFLGQIKSEETKKAAWADFSQARSWGISGFPSLVGQLSDDRLALLARGWAPADLIRARIESLNDATVG